MRFLIKGVGTIWNDFVDQSLFMKVIISWGWLAVAVMLLSVLDALLKGL
tara:strand:+ start:361 stop:507 length:147 start_codon:yes stop_codon:yes gene_type:complete